MRARIQPRAQRSARRRSQQQRPLHHCPQQRSQSIGNKNGPADIPDRRCASGQQCGAVFVELYVIRRYVPAHAKYPETIRPVDRGIQRGLSKLKYNQG